MNEDISDILSPYANGIRLTIRAKPGLTRAHKPKIVDLGEDRHALEIAVAARAEDGKANQALIDYMAKELGLKKNDLSIKIGASSRLKIIEAHGDPSTLRTRLLAWLNK